MSTPVDATMRPWQRVNACRICASSELDVFLRLGDTPLANSFIRPDEVSKPELRVPLEVMRCGRCGLVQLTVVVDPEVLFRDYAYTTSASAPMRAHFDELANELVARFAPPGSFVVEIGSNDGVLLRPLVDRGSRALGIEPASNLAAAANKVGLETWNDFFGLSVGHRLRAERGAAKVVVGNNVLAHIARLRDVAMALDAVLDDDGVFVAEVPYLIDLLDHLEYDTVYHEHLSYFHLGSLSALFSLADMELFDARRISTHGGSIRMYVGRSGKRPPTAELDALIAVERDRMGDIAGLFGGFAQRVSTQREQLTTLLNRLRDSGKRLAGYGATAKGNTMLNYCEIGTETLSFIADTTPFKQGLLTPGSHIPVRDESAIESDEPDVMLLLAWNYADSIVARMDAYVRRGGRFIHPIPLPRLIP